MGRRQKHYRLNYCHRASGKRVRFQRDLHYGYDEDTDAFKTKLTIVVRELEAKRDGEPVACDDDAAESTVSNSAASGSNSAASGAK